MSARLLFEVALRVLGVWFLFYSVNTLTMALASYLHLRASPMASQSEVILVATVVSPAIQVVVGAALVFFAPAVAAWFYPRAVEDEEERSIRVGPGDVYRTACFVLGAYLLVQAAEPAGRLVIAAIRGLQPWMQADLAITTVRLFAFASGGVLLVFGSRRISELMLNLRYDPDTIPKQQVSIAMLLVLIVVFGIILAVVRLMA